MRVSPRTHAPRAWTRRPLRRDGSPPRLWPHILGAWVVTVTGVTLVGLGVLWFLGFPAIDRPGNITVSALDAIATRAFAVVAGLSGIALLVIAYHRQRNNDLENLRAQKAAEREDIKLFNDRFTSAYTELGGEHAAVRLGAVHSLAHLADDAPTRELRQTCIDVLCAYVRMPYEPEPASPTSSRAVLLGIDEDVGERQTEEHHARLLEYASFREVRHSVLRVVGNRLSDADSPWQGHRFDFTGAVFDGGHFRSLHLTSGHLNFNEARFDGGEVDFRYSFFGDATVSFRGAAFIGGIVNFRHVRFAGEWREPATRPGDNRPVIWRQGRNADFSKARFDGAEVLFHDARFAETSAGFNKVEFVSGRVEFSRNGDEESSGALPFGLLEAVAKGTPGTVALSRAWTRPEDGGDASYSPGSTPSPENPPAG